MFRRTCALVLGAALAISTVATGPVAAVPHRASASAAAVTITSQPRPVTALDGQSITFTARASGTGVRYQWQRQLAGGRWLDLPGMTSYVLRTTAKPAENGARFRLRAAVGSAVAYSTGALLTVKLRRPAVTRQPSTQRVTSGTTAVFSAAVSGYAVRYQWQVWGSGAWHSMRGATRSSFPIVAGTVLDGRRYRLVASNSAGTVVSATVALFVNSTRRDPLPVGKTVTLKNWRVTLLQVIPDAAAEEARQGFTPPPPAGQRDVLGVFRVQYIGTGSGTPWFELDAELVSGAGRTYTDTDRIFWSNSIYGIDDLYHGATGDFVTIAEIPRGEAPGSRWKITDSSDWEDSPEAWFTTS